MVRRKLTDQQKAFVSYYVGEARMNASVAAELAGYASGSSVMSRPQVREAIDQALDDLRSRNILSKWNRLEILISMSDRALAIREARAGHYAEMIAAGQPVEPGAETGMLVRSPKAIPAGGGDVTIVDEWTYDRALAADIRQTLEHTAKELGEWNEKHQVTGEDGGPIKVAVAESAEQKLLAAIAGIADRSGAIAGDPGIDAG